MKKILIIDDDELFLETIERLLKSHNFYVKAARDGLEAIDMAMTESFDLIISDVRMPGMDGIETIKRLKEHEPGARSIVITGYASDSAPIQAIKLGVDDYINKPFHVEELIASVRRSLERCEKDIDASSSVSQMQKKYHALIEEIINAVEEEHAHFHRHARGVTELAVKMGGKMEFEPDRLQMLRLAATLHDIGMLGIKESVLEKKDSLSDKDLSLIRETPAVTREMLKNVEGLRPIIPIIYHLHEKYDGTGYPDGISGEDIPLESRILAVAEAYISLTAPRSYRERKEEKEALEIIDSDKARGYDPRVVDILHGIVDEEHAQPPDTKRDRGLHSLLVLAMLYFKTGNYSLSESAVSRLLDSSSTDPTVSVQARILKSKIKAAGSNSEEALESAQEALKLAKKSEDQLLSARAFEQLGIIWRESGKYSEAEISLKKARQIFEEWGNILEHTRAGLHLALVYRKKWEKEGAQESLYKETLADGLETISSGNMEAILLDEGTEFLPLLYSALEWNLQPESLGRILKEIFRRHPDECSALFLQGRDIHLLFLLECLPRIGGKGARDTLESLAKSQVEPIRRQAISILERLSEEEKPLLEIHLLGHFSLFLGGREVDDSLWQTRHARNLFIFLALNSDKTTSEERLMDIFWPDSPPDKARQNLHTTLTRIRNVFRKHPGEVSVQDYVTRSGEFLKLNPGANYWIDTGEFERCISDGARLESAGNFRKAIIEYEKAKRLYKGPLLEGIYEDWLLRRRDELQEKYLNALWKLASYHLDRGGCEAALSYARSILDEDPFNSRGVSILMKSLSTLGKRDAAVRKYHEYCKEMKAELGVPPDPEVIKIYYQIVDGRM